MGEDNLHKGHRERMRKKVEQYGLEVLPPHEVLEYLLYFVIPRKNTNPIAHALISRFGGFAQVLEADPSQLAQVEGMGESAARLLHSYLQVARYYGVEKTRQHRRLSTEQEAMEFAKPLFIGHTSEILYAVILDDNNCVIRAEQIGSGLPGRVESSAGKLAKAVFQAGGTAVILAHNHPAGCAKPSSQDIITTGKMVKALGILGIDLKDHIVVAGQEATSMLLERCMPIYDPIRGEVEYNPFPATL